VSRAPSAGQSDTHAGSHDRLRQSLSEHARRRRWTEFLRRFPDIAQLRVLDLGGTVGTWLGAPFRPAHVVVVNVDPRLAGHGDWYLSLVGDACDPDPEVRARDYDLVFSNSLLEHVGGHAQRRRLAGVVDQLGPLHWVQTPYRYFPVEPHWLIPGMQFLPVATRVAIARRRPFGPANRTTPVGELVDEVAAVELVSAIEMRSYFPSSDIWFERVAGLPKSLVAVRG
jgi:hypothetical protein